LSILPTWTVTGLVDEKTGELYVSAVFEGQHAHADRHADTDVRGRTMERFLGYFAAATSDEAEEMARQTIRHPPGSIAPRLSKTRKVTTVPLGGGKL